jgi:hypothetical protein
LEKERENRPVEVAEGIRITQNNQKSNKTHLKSKYTIKAHLNSAKNSNQDSK